MLTEKTSRRIKYEGRVGTIALVGGTVAVELRARAGLAMDRRNSTMRLSRGEVIGYNFDRMTVEFTMRNQDRRGRCPGGC
jgi:hypothetical protein